MKAHYLRLILIALLVFAGCATTAPKVSQEELNTLPDLVVYHTGDGEPVIYDQPGLLRRIDRKFWEHDDRAPKIHTLDRSYIVVDHDWMLELIEWTKKFFWFHDVRWRSESFDCDNFADALKAFAFLSGAHVNHTNAQVIVGTMVVDQQVAFAGVSAGGQHALNFFISNQGIFVVEPQSSTVVPLDVYPNRHWVKAIYFD